MHQQIYFGHKHNKQANKQLPVMGWHTYLELQQRHCGVRGRRLGCSVNLKDSSVADPNLVVQRVLRAFLGQDIWEGEPDLFERHPTPPSPDLHHAVGGHLDRS